MGFVRYFLLNLRIQRKIVICFLSIMLISVLLVSVFTHLFAERIILGKSVMQTQEIIQQLSLNVEHNVRLINEKLSFLAYDTHVQDQLRHRRESSQTAEAYARERSVSKVMVLTYTSALMTEIVIYGDRGNTFRISSDPAVSTRDDSAYLELARKADGRNVVINETFEGGDIQIVKKIKDITTLESLGVLRAGLKKSAIQKLLREVFFSDGGQVLLLDEQGQLILGESAYYEQLSLDLFSSTTGDFSRQMGMEKMHVVYQKSPYTGWLTVGILPRDRLRHDFLPLQLISILIAVFISICCVLLAQLLNRLIVHPLGDTVKVLRKYEKGDFSARLPEDRSDEIGELSSGINSMIGKIDTLINEVYRSELLKKESEFKALQAQINPHFLYNTLDTINWMAKKEGMDSICNMVKAVGDLMRISISNKHSFIPVSEELRYVEEYLYIQGVRYGERVQFEIQADPALLDQVIPKLILQPIVENAVVHGIENSPKRGMIRITGAITEDDALFVIEDTGVGMTTEQIDAVLNENGQGGGTSHTSMGILMVHQRIQYVYGTEYGLVIDSEPDEWTRVAIRIPFGVDADETYMAKQKREQGREQR